MGGVRRRRKVRDALFDLLRVRRALRQRELAELTVHHARIVSVDLLDVHDGARKEKTGAQMSAPRSRSPSGLA
jgi:hypothetical protein